jgi:hypothetical protein
LQRLAKIEWNSLSMAAASLPGNFERVSDLRKEIKLS